MGAHLVQLSVKDAAKEFDGVFALRRVSLDIRIGEAVALVGPNGAGKSTLLGVMSTLLRPTQGTLTFFGAAGRAHPLRSSTARARIGLLSHETFLYADLTAEENLRFWGRLHGSAPPLGLIRERLQRVGLNESAWNRTVRTYSRGMRQRLGIARALLSEPDFFLLDEPFTGLDPTGASLLVGLLEERRENRALVICSHDLEAVAGLCQRAVVLRQGIVAVDRPFEDAADLRAAYSQVTSKPQSAHQASGEA